MQCVRVMHGHCNWVNDICVMNEYFSLISCSSDSRIKIWNLNTGRCSTTFIGHNDAAYGVCENGKGLIYSCGLNNELYAWKPENIDFPYLDFANSMV